MFFSFKKKHNLVKSGILKGMTDIHSHILPGVDDGSPTEQPLWNCFSSWKIWELPPYGLLPTSCPICNAILQRT